jgi:anti-sigma B factor antagonist
MTEHSQRYPAEQRRPAGQGYPAERGYPGGQRRPGGQSDPAAELELTWHTDGVDAFVVVAGEVDMDTADQLSAVLSTALPTGRRLLIDLSGVGFFGSAGVRVLAEQHAAAVAGGRRIEFRGLPAMVRRVLQISGMLEWFEEAGLPADSSQDG